MEHLPAAPEGYEYRKRTLPENFGKGQFVTVGLYPLDAPDEKARHLAYVPTLYLDFDYKDQHDVSTFADLPDEELNVLIQAFDQEIRQNLPPPNAVVYSGYGVHYYFWRPEARWHLLEEARAEQAALVKSQPMADHTIDAGTRIMRQPGTWNNKRKLKRFVSLVHFDPTPRLVVEVPVPVKVPKVPAVPQVTLLPKIEEYNPFDYSVPLKVLFDNDPFFLWCQENPTKLKARSWYGAATIIAALAGEEGRASWHSFSAQDPDRYDPAQADKVYNQALERSLAGDAPQGYTTLQGNGDWPGASVSCRSPADLVQRLLAPKPKEESPKGRSDEQLIYDKEGRPQHCYANFRKLMRQAYGAKYSYNEMLGKVEYLGSPITEAHYGDVREQMADLYGMHMSKDDAASVVYETAQLRKYHPVRQYLNLLEAKEDPSVITGLLLSLGAEDTPLHRKYIECFLVSAIRRAQCVNPLGVKVDTMLVLQGNQGIKKSSFFRTLGSPWFSDTNIEPGTPDAMMQCRRHLIIEFAEVDQHKNAAKIKAFITSQVDSYRQPYARLHEEYPRSCVFVGTTNEESFLFDETGSRRYHVLFLKKEIDLDWVAKFRDAVWSHAMALEARGVPHWLTYEEEAARKVSNERAQIEERWEDIIQAWLLKLGAKANRISAEDVLSQAVQVPADRRSAGDKVEVGRILHRLGYRKIRENAHGSRRSVYVLPAGVEILEFPLKLSAG